MSDQLELGAEPARPVEICRDAADDTKPCEYVSACHETRQRLMHYANGGSIRGMECWAYQGLRARAARIERTQLAAGSSTVADDDQNAT